MAVTQLTSKAFKYILLDNKNLPIQHYTYYQKAYRMWKKTWSQTFLELDNDPTIYSDDFTRQDTVAALFLYDECIGSTSFRTTDFKYLVSADDSYFKVWSDQAIEGLISRGSKILVCSYFTIEEKYRGEVHGIKTKDLLMALLLEMFLSTGLPAMTGTLRNNKGINKCAYNFGATSLKQNVIMHGIPVDLVAFYREDILNLPKNDIILFAKEVWQQSVPDNSNTRLKKIS